VTDCLITLHAVMRDPAELAAAQADIDAQWRAALARKPRAARERMVATGEAARRHACHRIQKIIIITEKNWSEKC